MSCCSKTMTQGLLRRKLHPRASKAATDLMPKARYRDQIFADSDWRNLAPRVWQNVPKTVPYTWSIDDASLMELKDIAPDLKLHDGLDDRARVIAIQSHLSEQMCRASAEQLAEISKWIISSWGRIPDNGRRLPEWAEKLRGFEPETVDAFINKLGKDRIASWSKILAFARPERYAIYDSRTALTLNFALYCAGEDKRFVPPEGRPGETATASAFVSKGEVVLGYRDYLAFLHAVAGSSEGPITISELEAVLFAAAPVLSKAFVADLTPHVANAVVSAMSAAKQVGR